MEKPNIHTFLIVRKFMTSQDTLLCITEESLQDFQIYHYTKRVVVLFTRKSVRKKECLNIINNPNVLRTYEHIIVIGLSVSKLSSTLLQKHNIEFVHCSLVDFNRNQHILVPKYIILSPEEKQKVCQRFKCNSQHFPIILSTDPQVIYLGAKHGNFLHNTQDNVYRVVQRTA